MNMIFQIGFVNYASLARTVNFLVWRHAPTVHQILTQVPEHHLVPHVEKIQNLEQKTHMQLGVDVHLVLLEKLQETAQCALQGQTNCMLRIRCVIHVTKQIHGRLKAAQYVNVMSVLLE